MFELLTPLFLEQSIENFARAMAGVLRPKMTAFVLAAIYLLALARLVRFGLLHFDLWLAQRQRKSGKEPDAIALASGYAGIWLFWAMCGVLLIVGLAEVWLTVARGTNLDSSEIGRALGERALSVSKIFW